MSAVLEANRQSEDQEPKAAPDGGPVADSPLGRLADWGLREPWHVALLLPVGFDDFRVIANDAESFEDGVEINITAMVRSRPSTRFDGSRTPRTMIEARMHDGTNVTLTWFGDVRNKIGKILPGQAISASGQLRAFKGRWYLAASAPIESAWVGRCRPRYPGGKTISPDLVRMRVMTMLRRHLDVAAARIMDNLTDLADEAEVLEAAQSPAGIDTLQRLIVRAHCPMDPTTGEAAIAAMERIAAMITVRNLLEQHQGQQGQPRDPLALDLKGVVKQWPFPPTPSQWQSILKMEEVFSRPKASMMLLSGDVGSGKTLCYMTLAVAVARQGGAVAIMLPNTVLAEQVYETAKAHFQDVPAALVTGGTKQVAADDSRILIGTTALLSRQQHRQYELVISDEQQKLGAEQRRALLKEKTHILDVTATAIPRTLALARFGVIETHHLQQGHAVKAIKTQIWMPEQMRQLYAQVRETIAMGDRVLVVYPAIDRGARQTALRNIEDAQAKWEAAFPGLVRILNGRLTETELSENLHAIINGEASIGICTSVIEVGINIPRLRRVVVVHPERFGLTTLHQFRGRLAREGGAGSFDMLLTTKPKEKTLQRLQVMERTTDGYEIAREDLRLRGPGELMPSGVRQSGGAMSILFQREIDTTNLEGAEPIVTRWLQRTGVDL